MISKTEIEKINNIILKNNSFVITTHHNPDGDGLGSEIAMAEYLRGLDKKVSIVNNSETPHNYNFLDPEKEIIVFDNEKHREIVASADVYLILDISDWERLREIGRIIQNSTAPKICIDHHHIEYQFADIDVIYEEASSTGELVFEFLTAVNFTFNSKAATALYTCILTDTGSFRYSNTTPLSFRIAAEMMDYGVKPWELSRRIMDEYGHARLKLLRLALDTIEFHNKGQIGIIMITREMFEATHADRADSDKFVDYPRFVSGVELAVLIRQKGENEYKFSLRSNGLIDVARLASRFGGGGHIRAAGFDADGSISDLKRKFLQEANQVLDDLSN